MVQKYLCTQSQLTLNRIFTLFDWACAAGFVVSAQPNGRGVWGMSLQYPLSLFVPWDIGPPALLSGGEKWG